MKKRFFILLAALIVCLAGLTLSASATDPIQLTKEYLTNNRSYSDSSSGRTYYFEISEGDYQLAGDIELDSYCRYLQVKDDATIDLNGYVLTGIYYSSPIHIVGGATLTIKDSRPSAEHTDASLPKGGIITGTTWYSVTGLVVVGNGTEQGSLILESGTVYGGRALEDGNYKVGGVYVVNGSFYMKGGSISNCKIGGRAVYGAGGVFVDTKGTFYMSGGTISGCEGNPYGVRNNADGVYNMGKMYANGGTISSAVNNKGSITRSSTATDYTLFNTNVSGDGTIDDSLKLTVTFSSDGQTTEQKVLRGQTVSAPSVSKTGHTLDGWYKGDTKWDFGTSVTESMTLTAKWKIKQYTITFETGGGTAISPITQNYNTAITAPADPTRTGYTFDGWDQTIPTTMPAESLTITAKWTANTNTAYTIEYYRMDTTGNYPTAPTVTEAKTGTTDTTASVPTFSEPGWQVDATRSVLSGNISGDGSLVLKVYLARELYTVTFLDGYSNGTLATASYYFGTTVEKPSDPSRPSYFFAGWYHGDTAYDFSTPVTSHLTLTAKWNPVVPGHAVKVTQPDHGTLSVWPEAATPGATITITFCPAPGYQFAELTVLDASGTRLNLTNLGNGQCRFDMPNSAVTVSAAFMEGESFADVPAGCYYESAVRWAVENGITSGLDAARFGANATCTRAQLVTFLWRAAGSPASTGAMTFTDVPENAYSAQAVCWAASLEIVTGYGNGRFGAEDAVTREQVAAILYRFARATGMDVTVGEDTNILSYADAFEVSEYALPAFQWACGAKVVQGANGALSPKAPCTRAQIVTMLHRLLAK